MKFSIFFQLMLMLSFSTSAQDWPALERYRQANKSLENLDKSGRIVFMGNSITEGWINADPEFFEKNNLVNRGIGGQTTPQMLLRFRQDVIDLKPIAVFILAGINDIAGNTGPSSVKMIEDNIQNMAVLARDAGIRVVLCSVLPSNSIPWRNNMDPSSQIHELNEWLKDFARAHDFMYLDYYSALADGASGLPSMYSHDGVHPNLKAYQIMEKQAMPVIQQLRK